MGGKHKVANRTKNNARPSSSGRSAELLGSSMPQFAGFSTVKDTGLLLPGFTFSKPEEFDSSVDPNFQLVLKKISKKDSTTKLKGLQEFADLIKSSECEAVKAVLPLWPRFYNILATDTDNRVREATHFVHHQIVLKVKRNIAPYLKQLIAPWFTSQYDTYPPAATIASQAFKDAFPPNKFQEAIVFCQEEILAYISDNLLVQTAQTLSNSKTVSSEESEAKYERVLIACMQGYYLYLIKISSEQIKKMAEPNNNIVSSNKFWKLAKHQVPPIRSAFFKVLTALCQKAVFLLDGKGSQNTNAIFGNLDENEPTVLPYVWESALLTMSTIKDWYTYINVDKLYITKLWKILKLGGQGNATVICPNLLPVLSHLPPSVEMKASQFFSNFFGCLQLGLKQKSVISSRSESAAVATAMMECLQYVILKNQSDPILCKQLIQNHIIDTIEWCLLENQISYKIVFNQIAFIVQYWNRNSLQYDIFLDYLDFFFDGVKDIFRATLFNFKEHKDFDLISVASKQIEFLQSLKHTSIPKRQCKVKFASTNKDVNNESAISDDDGNQTISSSDKSYYERLNIMAYNICEDYVNYINEKQSKELFGHLFSLIINFDTEKFFVNLHDRMKKKNENSSFIDIYSNLLYKWLESDHLRSKHVVDLIFLLFSYINEDEKQMVLNTLTELVSEDLLGWCISKALSFPYNNDPLVQNWLRNGKVSRFLVSIAQKEINDDCTAELSALFKLALTENKNGELFIHKKAIANIIEKLISTLSNQNEYSTTVDTCSSLAAYISAIIYTENLLLTYGESLLLALFRLSCKSNVDPEIISSETLWEVNTSWQDALSILSKGLSKNKCKELANKIADVIEDEFLNNSLEKNTIDHLSTVIVDFLRAMHKSVPFSVSKYMNTFLERSFTAMWNKHINNMCMVAEYVKGNLCSPYNEIVVCNILDVEEIDILRYFVWNYLKLCVISSNIEQRNNEDEDEEGIEENSLEFIYVIDNKEELIAQLLHDLSLAESLLDNYKNIKHYSDILQYYQLMKIEIKTTFMKLNDEFNKNVHNILKEKAFSLSWFWCKAIFMLYSNILPKSLNATFEEIVENKQTSKYNLGILHLIQVFGPYLDSYCINVELDTVGSVIVLTNLLHCDNVDGHIADVFGKIDKLRNENTPEFLFDNSNIKWERSQEIIETVKCCSGLMKYKYSSLTRRYWDFGVLSLVSWSTNCLKIRAHYKKFYVQALFAAVAQLFINTDNQIRKLKEEKSDSSYINEWEDLFVESCHTDLAQLWFYFAEQMEIKEEQRLIYLPLLHEFGTVINNFNSKYIFHINDTSLPKWTKFLKRSCSLLVSPLPILQLWGYKMLLVLVPGLISIDSEAVNTNTPHKKGLIFEQFKEKLVQTHEIVNTMLEEFKLGEDSCRVKPSTDSFTYTFAYLLLWDVLLTLCEQSSTELRYQYADWLRNEDLLKHFLNNIFRLMPSEILHYNEGKSKTLLNLFLEKPPLSINDSCNSEKIEYIVCWLYASTLTQLPALVRQWWTGIETRIAQIVEKVTTIYVSPHLCHHELTDVTQHQTKFKNMVIKVIPSVREVIAIYTVDEAQMELVITLPSNYPLGGPDVQCNRQIGGTTHKQWLLQLKKCVLHQNGRIWDGLSLWNNNLDKKFDGVEECCICFAVLHPGTYQLPKLSCQTCKKKFHSACLYKWFSTSNKSSCPICRNLF